MILEEIKKLDEEWQCLLEPYLESDAGRTVIAMLETYLVPKQGMFWPAPEKMFAPLQKVKLEEVKVVIVGHYPYPNQRHATGLPFSNPPNTDMAKSVCNIFKSITNDIGGTMPTSGCLEHWPPQGILLLNKKFTVDEATKREGHSDIGWEELSAEIVQRLSDTHKQLVFLLWGTPARQVEIRIDKEKHHVLTSRHPSARDNYLDEFLNCKHFSKTNDFLEENGHEEINWIK